ncbi:MAG: hypothetical protein ACRD7E_12235 [Bryobacteraceae bacterium]
MIHVWHGLLPLEVMLAADVPHRRLGAADENQKQALSDLRLRQVLFGEVMLALPDRAVNDRNAICFRIAADTTAETARRRIRCVLSSVSSDPVSARHQMRNPPGSCPIRK